MKYSKKIRNRLRGKYFIPKTGMTPQCRNAINHVYTAGDNGRNGIGRDAKFCVSTVATATAAEEKIKMNDGRGTMYTRRDAINRVSKSSLHPEKIIELKQKHWYQ